MSYIGDLVDEQTEYSSTGDLIRVLIDKWIERESSRYSGEAKDFKKKMMYFSMNVAGHIYEQQSSNVDNIYISQESITQISEENEIELNLLTLKSKSFLNRNSEGDFKFSHKVFLEYFVALKMIYDKEFCNSYYSEAPFNSSILFYQDICKNIKNEILNIYPEITITYVTSTGLVHHQVPLQSVDVGKNRSDEVIELIATDKKYSSVATKLIQIAQRIGGKRSKNIEEYIELQKKEIASCKEDLKKLHEDYRKDKSRGWDTGTERHCEHSINKHIESYKLINDLHPLLDEWRQSNYVSSYKVRKEFFE